MATETEEEVVHFSQLRSYSLEEIDDNLATLSNLLKFSKKCNKDDVNKQIDNWLDRRSFLTEVQDG